MKHSTTILIFRYWGSILGLFLVALGISLTIHSQLGTAPLSCPALVLSMVFPSISIGGFVAATNACMVFIQLALLRRKFKLKYLLEIPVALALGYMVDFWELFLAGVSPSNVWVGMGMIVLSSAITAIGIQIEIVMQALMLPIDLTVLSFTIVWPKIKFSTVKILLDSGFVAVSAIACLCVWGHLLGNCQGVPASEILTAASNGVVIGLGTIIMAFLPGIFMIYTEKLTKKVTAV